MARRDPEPTPDPLENYAERFEKSGGNFPAIVSDLEKNPKFKQRVKKEADRLGIDPNILWTNMMEEGLYNYFRDRDVAYSDLENPDEVKHPEYAFLGLDTTGERLPKFQEEGLVQDSVASQYEVYERKNDADNPEPIKSVAGKGATIDQRMRRGSALQGAEISSRRDTIRKQAEEIGLDGLPKKDLDYLTFASFNAGKGAPEEIMKQMKSADRDTLTSYMDETSVEGAKIDRSQLPFSDDLSGRAVEGMQNADRRTRNLQALRDFGLFNQNKEETKKHGGYINKNSSDNMVATKFGGPQPQEHVLSEKKLFLGGVTDAIGDAADWAGDAVEDTGEFIGNAATETGDFIKENPGIVGTGLGLAAAPFTGGLSLAAGASLGGMAGKAVSTATGDATGKGLKKKRARQKRAEAMSRRRAMRMNKGGPGTTQASQGGGFAHGGYIQDKFAHGGSTERIGQDAKKIKGPKHENGGVQLDPQTEVEGGETMDNVNGKEYVFSERLSVPESILPDDKSQMSFADYHEHLVENDANQSEIDELAAIQERVAGRDDSNATSPSNVGSNKRQDTKDKKQKVMGPLGKKIKKMSQLANQKAGGGMVHEYAYGGEKDYAYGGERKMEEGGYYAVKADETEGDEPKYPINSADDVRDAWKLRNHGDYEISQETLENRIKRKADEYGVDLGDSEDEKAYGGYRDEKEMAYGGEKEYQDGGFSATPGISRSGSIQMAEDAIQSTVGEGGGGEGFLSQAADVGRAALPYLPAAMNIGRALFEDSEVSDVPYTPPSGRAESTVRQMETDVDTDPQEAAVDKSLRSVIADPNASMNQKRAAAATAAEQKAQIRSQAENKETGLRNQMLNRLSSLQARRDQAISQGRTQAAQAERRQQMKADEAQRNLLTSGLQQASRTFQKQQRYDDKREKERLALEAELASIPNNAVRNYVLNKISDDRTNELLNR